MRVNKVTLSFGQKRSANYQTCDVAMSIEVELAEGETVRDAVEKYRPALVAEVSRTADAEISKLTAPREGR